MNTMSSRGTVHFKKLQSSAAQWQLLLHNDQLQLIAGDAKGGIELSVEAIWMQRRRF